MNGQKEGYKRELGQDAFQATGGEDNNGEKRGEEVKGTSRWGAKNEEGVLKKSVNVKVKEDNSAYLCWNSGRQNPIRALSSLDPCWQGALKHGFQLCWVQSCISTNVMVKRLWVPNKWSLEENRNTVPAELPHSLNSVKFLCSTAICISVF